MQQYEAVSQLNSERYARLERAQVLVNQFWETYEELNPWIEETQALISQLPPPAIDHEQLKQQQDDMRVRGCRVCISCPSVLHLFLLNFPLFLAPVLFFLGELACVTRACPVKTTCCVGALLDQNPARSQGNLGAFGSPSCSWQEKKSHFVLLG